MNWLKISLTIFTWSALIGIGYVGGKYFNQSRPIIDIQAHGSTEVMDRLNGLDKSITNLIDALADNFKKLNNQTIIIKTDLK